MNIKICSIIVGVLLLSALEARTATISRHCYRRAIKDLLEQGVQPYDLHRHVYINDGYPWSHYSYKPYKPASKKESLVICEKHISRAEFKTLKGKDLVIDTLKTSLDVTQNAMPASAIKPAKRHSTIGRRAYDDKKLSLVEQGIVADDINTYIVIESQGTDSLAAQELQTLKTAKEHSARQGNTYVVMKYLQKMRALCDDVVQLQQITLELADAYFDEGQLIDAEKMYREFTQFYPGSLNAEYAFYRAILCSFYAGLDTYRDQTKTHDTIKLIESFLDKGARFSTYKDEVERIGLTCREKLLQAELDTFRFYLKRKNLNSARKRLEGIREDYLTYFPEFTPTMLSIERDLAKAQGDHELALHKEQELAALTAPQLPLELPRATVLI